MNYSEALVVHGCRMVCINVYLLFVAHVKDCCQITDTWVYPYHSILKLDATHTHTFTFTKYVRSHARRYAHLHPHTHTAHTMQRKRCVKLDNPVHIGSCTAVRPISGYNKMQCLIELLLPSALSLQCTMYQNKKTHGPQRWGWGRRGLQVCRM